MVVQRWNLSRSVESAQGRWARSSQLVAVLHARPSLLQRRFSSRCSSHSSWVSAKLLAGRESKGGTEYTSLNGLLAAVKWLCIGIASELDFVWLPCTGFASAPCRDPPFCAAPPPAAPAFFFGRFCGVALASGAPPPGFPLRERVVGPRGGEAQR